MYLPFPTLPQRSGKRDRRLVGNRPADLTESVENERLSAQIVRELGLQAAVSEMAVFGDQKVLVV